MRFLLFCGLFIIATHFLPAKNFTIQEYGEMLHTIEVVAKQSLEKKEYLILVNELKRIPDRITVEYTIQNKTIQKNTHLTWLKAYLNNYLSETEAENGKKTIEILENAQEESEQGDGTKIIPIADKIHTLIITLQTMREELLLMGYKSEDEQTIKNKLNTILTNKFETEKKSNKENWLNQKLNKLYRWISKNFNGIKNIWNWFLFLVLLGVIVYLVVQASKYIQKSKQFVEETTHNGLLQADDPRSSKELVLKAKQHEKSGNLRMAVRYYYVAFIIQLEELDILPYQPYFTNWEYHRKLLSMGYKQEEIYHLTALFDKVWYGMYAISPTEYQNYVLNYEKTENILAAATA